MRRTTRRAILGVLLLHAGSGVRLAGQAPPTLPAAIARLEARIDSLRREQGAAGALAAAARHTPALARPDEGLVPMRVGIFDLRTNPSPLPLQAGAEAAWARLAEYYGVERDSVRTSVHVVQAIDPDSGGGPLDTVADLTFHWDASTAQVRDRLLHTVSSPDPDPELLAWLGRSPSAGDSLDRALGLAHRELLLAPFSPGHACVTGAITACRVALGLSDGGIAERFPEPEDRRRAVWLVLERGRLPSDGPLVDACIAGEGAGSCATLLGGLPPAGLPALSGPRVRATLLEVALRTGGAEGYRRLRRSVGRPMAERLAVAAGVPLDTLLGGWQARMSADRLEVSAGALGGGVAALGWTLFFLACAVGSSRWRAA
ncbi:MAG TPA: hypothetical protein VFS07_07730 [Gemmatimonadales bacterium]|nr:hypothetical protein [Gemmatimonadales bacterium]